MEKSRPCGCKGCRTCLICESLGAKPKLFDFAMKKSKSYVYCPHCNKAWKGWDVNSYMDHPNHTGEPLEYPGIFIMLDFLSHIEEESLMNYLDEMPWDNSQSGRRKQNFGPKTNFKKRKIVPGNFHGFPKFSKIIQDRFDSVDLLKGYETIEQCSLEYDPQKGASIDPHIDDCWIWGERIITVNFLSDSVLTMTPYRGDKKKYNLLDAESYVPIVNKDRTINMTVTDDGTNVLNSTLPDELPDVIVRIPMPRRSLLVIYGEPRYHWEHSILREDIIERRVCLAYREFTPPYLKNQKHGDIGDVIRSKSKLFWDHKEFYKNIVINT